MPSKDIISIGETSFGHEIYCAISTKFSTKFSTNE